DDRPQQQVGAEGQPQEDVAERAKTCCGGHVRREIEPVDKKGDGHHQGDQPGQHTTDKTCGTHSFKTSPKVPSFGPTLTRKPDVGLTPCPGVRLTRLRVLYRPRKSCTRACVRWYPYEDISRTNRAS